MRKIEHDMRSRQNSIFNFVLIHAGTGALAGALVVALVLLTDTLNLWSLITSTNYMLLELVGLLLVSVFLFSPLAVITAVTFFLPSETD